MRIQNTKSRKQSNNKQSKRALYESIMRDVAKVVKKRLNESDDECRYVLVYDGDIDYNGFCTSNINAAINAAINDYEEGGYDTIEILDKMTDRIVWTTDED